MSYSIVYSSRTGNTRTLAEKIRDSLPAMDCRYFGEPDGKALTADLIFVGFWTNRGCCDDETADFLSKLEGKKVFLFGTAGFGQEAAYFDRILDSTEGKLAPGAQVVGRFMCQGRMPMAVRQRYEKMLDDPNPRLNLTMMIENFDQALSHPDAEDLEHLAEAVRKF